MFKFGVCVCLVPLGIKGRDEIPWIWMVVSHPYRCWGQHWVLCNHSAISLAPLQYNIEIPQRYLLVRKSEKHSPYLTHIYWILLSTGCPRCSRNNRRQKHMATFLKPMFKQGQEGRTGNI